MVISIADLNVIKFAEYVMNNMKTIIPTYYLKVVLKSNPIHICKLLSQYD